MPCDSQYFKVKKLRVYCVSSGDIKFNESCLVADDQSCPICLNDFEEQQIGLPNNCRHAFCIDCILEWSKVISWLLLFWVR